MITVINRTICCAALPYNTPMDSMRFDDGCGRYVVDVEPEDLQQHYRLPNKAERALHSYDVRPTQTMPVVRAEDDGTLQLDQMRWGLVPFWSKKPSSGYTTFNARDDAVFTKPTWRSVYHKRLLVPATGYFEWTKPTRESGKAKQKYYFHLKDSGLFSFAGFYDVWKDAEGVPLYTYTLITTEPNQEARRIHDRMPVILTPAEEHEWLDPARTKRIDLEKFLHPLPDGSLDIYEVGIDTKDWAYDDPSRITPLHSK